MCGFQKDLKDVMHKVVEQQEALKDMETKLKIASSELVSSRHALSDITNQLQKTARQRDTARKQVFKMQDKLETVYSVSSHYEDQMQTKHNQLTDYIQSSKSEACLLQNPNPAVSCSHKCDAMFCFDTMDGGHIYTYVQQL